MKPPHPLSKNISRKKSTLNNCRHYCHLQGPKRFAMLLRISLFSLQIYCSCRSQMIMAAMGTLNSFRLQIPYEAVVMGVLYLWVKIRTHAHMCGQQSANAFSIHREPGQGLLVFTWRGQPWTLPPCRSAAAQVILMVCRAELSGIVVTSRRSLSDKHNRCSDTILTLE